MANQLELLESTDGYAVGRLGPVFLYTWRSQPTLAGAAAFDRYLRQLAEATKGAGFLMLGVVEAGAAPPDSATRDEIARLLQREYGQVLKASALVSDGPGVRGAMVRAVVTALSLLTSAPYPNKVFKTPAEAAGFVVEFSKSRGLPVASAAELAQALESLRAAPRADARAA